MFISLTWVWLRETQERVQPLMFVKNYLLQYYIDAGRKALPIQKELRPSSKTLAFHSPELLKGGVLGSRIPDIFGWDQKYFHNLRNFQKNERVVFVNGMYVTLLDLNNDFYCINFSKKHGLVKELSFRTFLPQN